MKDIETGFNILFLRMKKAKKKRVGDVEVLKLLNGGFKIISNDLNASNADYYLTGKTSL